MCWQTDRQPIAVDLIDAEPSQLFRVASPREQVERLGRCLWINGVGIGVVLALSGVRQPHLVCFDVQAICLAEA